MVTVELVEGKLVYLTFFWALAEKCVYIYFVTLKIKKKKTFSIKKKLPSNVNFNA